MKNKIVKQKTKNSVLRRIKITGSGKIMHRSNFKGHLRRNKSAKQKRSYRKTKYFSPSLTTKIKQSLGS